MAKVAKHEQREKSNSVRIIITMLQRHIAARQNLHFAITRFNQQCCEPFAISSPFTKSVIRYAAVVHIMHFYICISSATTEGMCSLSVESTTTTYIYPQSLRLHMENGFWIFQLQCVNTTCDKSRSFSNWHAHILLLISAPSSNLLLHYC